MAEQLTLDFDGSAAAVAAVVDEELLAQIAEPSMTAAEREAVIRDALGGMRAKPCQCARQLLLADETGAQCLKCGREPRR